MERSVVLGAVLSITLAVTACRINNVQPRTNGPFETEIDRLAGQALRPCREEWYAAVVRLGQLAGRSPELRSKVWRASRVNSVGMKFVWIGPGAFWMGPGGDDLLFPRCHFVELSRGFFVSVTEVTNSQMAAVCPDYQPDERTSPRPDTPAVHVTWDQAALFCKLLTEREGARYRLPTEAEWEYACRAGSDGAYFFGDDARMLPEYAWYGAPHEPAAPVASFQPNAWGIYDTQGNALEWVFDWYAPYSSWVPVGAGAVLRDPTGPTEDRGWGHVVRGGYWAQCCPPAFTSDRRGCMPSLLDRPLFFTLFDREYVGVREATGFRVVREGA